MSRHAGQISEKIAADFLAKNGFVVIDKNVSFSFGELDLVVKKNNLLVFVEVKSRKSLIYGHPYEAVTLAKQRKIILAAQAYLARFKGAYESCRFDVISLVGIPPNVQIDHIENAFFLMENMWPAY